MSRGPSLAGEQTASGNGGEETPSPETGAKHSGKLLVRMPATLHDELARAAQAEGVSLNQLITGVLASSVGWRGNGVHPMSPKQQEGSEPAISPRLTRAALAANLAVVLLAAAAAIALLVAAWQAGF